MGDEVVERRREGDGVERAEEAGHWLDNEKLDEKVRADIAYNNAVKLLKL